MHNPHYLTVSRHNIFYFRFPVPPALHPFGRTSDVRCSLGTRCPREALRIARHLAYIGGKVVALSEAVRMDYDDIREALKLHFAREREVVKSRINKYGPLPSHEEQAYLNKQSMAETAIANNDFSLVGTEADLNEVIYIHSLPIESGTSDYKLLRNEYVKAVRASSRDIVTLNKTYEDYQFTTDPRLNDIKRAERKAKKTKLAATIDKYVEEKVRSEQWTAKTANGFRKMFDILLEYLGHDVSLHISAAVANDVKTMLMKLPKQARIKPELKDMPLREIIDLPDEHPLKKGNLIDALSIHKYLSAYSSFFEWAVRHKDTDENNFRGINFRIDKQKQRRDAFTKEQIETIYDTAQTIEQEHYKWGILIGLLTGARLEEIAQLLISDIKKEGKIWYFDINQEGKKKLKNRASERIVPIHSKLIDLGFLDFLKQAKKAGYERVLYGLPYTGNNGYGRNLGRWFNVSFLPALEMKRKGLTFHSLRHTVITMLQQADVEDSLIKRLVGHSQTDVTNNAYSKGQSLPQKQAAIEKL